MSHEFNPNPWRNKVRWSEQRHVDRTYPSGVARERPMLTARIHCEPEPEVLENGFERAGGGMNRVDLFNFQLRAGHGYRNEGEE
jgi:hypothetical protein